MGSNVPLRRLREIREKHAEADERREQRARNLFDLSGEFNEVDGVMVAKAVTSAFYADHKTYCRDCRRHAGANALQVWPHADDTCAHCGKRLDAARPLPNRVARRRSR